jgi:GNAT superfamily N-acetyltransferase
MTRSAVRLTDEARRPEPAASNCEIVRYQPDLKRALIEFQTHGWSPDPALNAAYFDWKYEQNPYLRQPLIYLAMHHGKAVAMRGFFGFKVEAGAPARSATCLYADDMVVAPGYRKRGLVASVMTSALEDLAESEYDYLFNLSAGPITLVSSLAMGWRSAGYVRPMWRQDRQRAMRAKLHDIAATAKKIPMLSPVIDRLRSLRQAPRPSTFADVDLKRLGALSNAGVSITVGATPRCADMAALVDRLQVPGPIRHVRDAEYLSWRFRNPLSRYLFVFLDETRLEGYLVLQEYTSALNDRNVVNIVDWEASRPQFRQRLLEAAIALTKPRRLVIWSATLPGATVALLEAHGFCAEPLPPSTARRSILVRSLAREPHPGAWTLAGTPLLETSSWDLRMLYSMCG